MFLHHILTRNEDALIAKVFWAQVNQTAKGDWCQVVREDLDTLGLSTLSFDEIAEMEKESLKKLVHERMASTALEDLEREKEGLSKMSRLKYDKLELQPYLCSPDLTLKQKRLTFRWRTRMVKVGRNFGSKDNVQFVLKLKTPKIICSTVVCLIKRI